MTTTTTTPFSSYRRVTPRKYIALRAMLQARGSDTERVEAGIDALRSPSYRELVLATQSAWSARRATTNQSDSSLNKWMPMPRAERVAGANELRAWLRDMLGWVRITRMERGVVEYRVVVTLATSSHPNYYNIRLWACDVGGTAFQLMDQRLRIHIGSTEKSKGWRDLRLMKEQAEILRGKSDARRPATITTTTERRPRP
jgi:hypothetical protein